MIVEDVMASPEVRNKSEAWSQKLNFTMNTRLSTDGTYRACSAILTQANIRAPRAVRADQAEPPEDSKIVVQARRGAPEV